MGKVIEGYKITELGEIPEEWEIKSIYEIAEFITKGTTPSTIGFDFVEDGINYIRAENINQVGSFEGEFLKISKECHEKLSRSVIKENDILVSIVGYYLGKTALVTSKEAPANTNQNLAIVRINSEDYFNSYIKIIFESNYLKSYIKKNLTEGAQPSLSLKQIGDFKIPIPHKKEQQKISSILSSVDEQIENTNKLIEKTKELKKGLMQKLLTKGIGHDRFKDSEIGRIPEDWEVKSLSNVVSINPESLNNRMREDYVINYIDIESVTTGNVNNIKAYTFGEAPSRARRIVRKNDVIISTVRPYLKAFTIIKESKDDLVCSTGFAVLRSGKKVEPDFIYQFTLSDNFLIQLSNKMVGSNYPAVNSSDIKEVLIQIPTLEEQKKIASILSSVDKKIHQYNAKKEKLQELKKGLMQKLLTGKIRVIIS